MRRDCANFLSKPLGFSGPAGVGFLLAYEKALDIRGERDIGAETRRATDPLRWDAVQPERWLRRSVMKDSLSASERESEARKNESRELVLVRTLDAKRDKIWRCWTEPGLLTQWFAPKPWSTPRAELDVRPGGTCMVVMSDPDGNEFSNPGVYLEVTPNEKLVFTDAFTSAWQPSEKPFMVAEIRLEDIGDGRTRYTATARHWSSKDRDAHEKMGFHEGWSQCADQLAELARTLK
jgi:uncharacterized protein YndB with AHSA1/START domain